MWFVIGAVSASWWIKSHRDRDMVAAAGGYRRVDWPQEAVAREERAREPVVSMSHQAVRSAALSLIDFILSAVQRHD